MKVRKIIAENMASAMLRVKEELGADAVILSDEKTEDGKILLTAAVEEKIEFGFDFRDEPENVPLPLLFDDKILRESLQYHGVIRALRDKFLAQARKIALEQKIVDNRRLLSLVFDCFYSYSDILDLQTPVKLFMGTPGSGKSTAIAKVATQAKFKNIKTCIISTDNVRAGANKQLEAFAKILDIDFYFCKDEKSLYETAGEAQKLYTLVLIDTPGINPFIESEVERIAKFADVVKNEAFLTIDAGRNTYEAVEISEIFAKLGARHLLATRLDLTRRIGAVLSVAGCGKFSLCSASVSSSIANGLAAIDSRSLARLVLS